jgi:hypothetical protein
MKQNERIFAKGFTSERGTECCGVYVKIGEPAFGSYSPFTDEEARGSNAYIEGYTCYPFASMVPSDFNDDIKDFIERHS